MKPKSLGTRTLLAALGSSTLAIPSATAAEIQKAAVSNTNNLNTGAAWVGGTAPGANDVALWDSTVTASNTADSETVTQLGGDVSWQGIRITDVAGAINQPGAGGNSNIRIRNTSSANTLTLGSAGIDMSTATQALLIESRVTLAADQTWDISDANTNGAPFGFNNSEDLGLQAQAANTAFNLGGNTLTLTGGGNVTITSGYAISNGTMNVQTGTVIQGGNTRGTSTASNLLINVSNGATLRLQNNNTSAVTNAAAISVSGAGSTLNFTLGNANGGSNINSSGAITMATGTTLTVAGNSASAFTQSGDLGFSGNVNWNYTGTAAHADGLVFSGDLTGSGSVSFSNTNTAANGQVRLSGDNSGFTGTMTLNGGSGNRTLRLMTAASGSAAATWAVNAGNILQVNGVSVQLGTLNGAGTVTNSHASNAATINVGAGSFSGAITNGAAATALIKVTSDTLTLSGASTYTGNTTINDGTIRIAGANNRLPTGSAVSFANAAGATLDLNGFNQEVRLLDGGGATGGTVTNTGAGTSVLTIRPSGGQGIFAGQITGDVRLEIVGNKSAPAFLLPRQRLEGVNNTFTGGVLVDGATLLVEADGSLGAVPGTFDAAAITLQNNGTLLNHSDTPLSIHQNRGITLGTGGGALVAGFAATEMVTVNSVISGAAGNDLTIMANSGIVVLTGENTFAGATVVQPVSGVFSSRLQLGDGGSTGSLSGTSAITNDGTLIINRNNDFTQAADLNNQAITGTGAFTQTGTGTTTLSLVNTYEGATNVEAGTLLVNGSISTSLLTTVQSGATLGGSGTVGALTIDAGGLFSPGNSTGIMTVDGDYIQNGQLNVEILGLNAGTQHDQVVVNGTVTLSGLLNITSFTGSYGMNDLIFILLNEGDDAISGTFTGLAQGAVVGNYLGFDWQISYTGDSTGNTFTGGNDVVLMAIPEPRAALLGGLGLLILLRRRRS